MFTTECVSKKEKKNSLLLGKLFVNIHFNNVYYMKEKKRSLPQENEKFDMKSVLVSLTEGKMSEKR